ncbi:amidohydrolase family protein [Amycolatopsis sp. La24]|uniref:amidohydrolase family protein n=1 Tax=Amycolatopsis sp. La24 TaxID=3028304 RepID=UPI0023AE976A|nr:amidohydrolase family protein [Amycolatopsis sp. La24]
MPQQLLIADWLLPGPAGQRIRDGAVLVEDDKILAAGPCADVEPLASPEAKRRDYPGATILPGLINCHVHLVFDAGPHPEHASAAATHTDMAERAQRLLHSGVTTIRDLGDRDGLAISLRDHLRTAAVSAPRIVASGPPITVPNGHCWFLGGQADGEAALRARVRHNAELGADVIKVMASGGQITPNSPSMWDSQFSRAQLAAIVDEATKCGLPVAAHAHGTDAIAAAVDAGAATIEHCTWLRTGGGGYDLRDDIAERMAERGVFACVAWPSDWQNFMRRLGPARADLVAKRFAWMVQHGISMIPGTDAGVANSSFDDYARALQFYVHLGHRHANVIEMATTTSARALGLGHATGQLSAGYAADILIVNGDPLADLDALSRVCLVLAQGRAAEIRHSSP